jgi:very-short-patch-repair endonuclease
MARRATRLSFADLKGKRIRITAGAALDATPARTARRRRTGPTPEDRLFRIVQPLWPTAVRNYNKAVPGRRLEVDIALVELRGGFELDGWEWHGRYLRHFLRDREKDQALFFAGWRILRISAGQVLKDPVGVAMLVERSLAVFQDGK